MSKLSSRLGYAYRVARKSSGTGRRLAGTLAQLRNKMLTLRTATTKYGPSSDAELDATLNVAPVYVNVGSLLAAAPLQQDDPKQDDALPVVPPFPGTLRTHKRRNQRSAKRAKAFHLEFDDVAITHLTFGREFMSAIESKQVASQEAERQQWVVKRAEQERIAVVTRAEGEAEAASIITTAMEKTGNAIVEVRRIDAAKEIAGKLAHSRNVVYLPNTGGAGGNGQGGGANLLLGLDNK